MKYCFRSITFCPLSLIYFSVTSDGTTGEAWTERLGGKDFRVGDYAKQVLRSPDFKPTNGVTTEVAVLKSMLWNDNDRFTGNIRAKAAQCNFWTLNAEAACLIREKFTDEDLEAMGLWWIVTMHDPINDSDGGPDLLLVHRDGGGRWLSACYGLPGFRWDCVGGFAFAVSSSSAKATADKQVSS